MRQVGGGGLVYRTLGFRTLSALTRAGVAAAKWRCGRLAPMWGEWYAEARAIGRMREAGPRTGEAAAGGAGEQAAAARACGSSVSREQPQRLRRSSVAIGLGACSISSLANAS